jgi:histidinol-phosphate aminotransferase
MSVLDLARPEIRAMEPYSSARNESSGGVLMLNANESSWAPRGENGLGLNRYPQPQPPVLIDRLAQLYGVDISQVLVGRGSDEAIDLLVRAFCPAGASAVLISPPTFGMYSVCARIQHAAVIEVPLQAPEFALDADILLAAVTPEVRVVFVCSPNNPTGNVVPLPVLEKLAAALHNRAVLVIDEAYIEFAGDASGQGLLDRYDHVCLLRTLSKAWALAGARVGCLLAHADVIALLRRIMPPYPMPAPCSDAALRALEDTRKAKMHVMTVLSERTRLSVALARLACVREVLPSRANFIAVRFVDPDAANRALLARGIVVRDIRRYPGLHDALRVTVGAPDENDKVLATLTALDADNRSTAA